MSERRQSKSDCVSCCADEKTFSSACKVARQVFSNGNVLKQCCLISNVLVFQVSGEFYMLNKMVEATGRDGSDVE